MAPSSLASHDYHEPQAKINHLQSEEISSLFLSAALFLTSFQVILAVFTALLQREILPRLYRKTYSDLQNGTISGERHHVSFVYHHVAAVIFPILLICGIVPAIKFICGSAEMGTALFSSKITIGNALFVLSQIYTAYYLFEITFRARFISIIALVHHIGLLLVTQTALVLGADPIKYRDASAEFYMCILWGMFDVATELPLHYVMIFWRLQRNIHRTCTYIACVCAVWVTSMALFELAVTTYLLAQSWGQWESVWHIVTPLLFSLWICTQLYGAKIFVSMAFKEYKLAAAIT